MFIGREFEAMKKYLTAVWIVATMAVLGSAVQVWATEPAIVADQAKTYSEAEAFNIGWPNFLGPCGNRLSLRTGTKVVRDISQAKVLWESETRDFGQGKGVTPMQEKPPTHRGSWNMPVMAENKVFGASFIPASAFENDSWSPDAQDVVFALDVHTGKTLWRTLEPEGILWSPFKRGGHQVSPVYYSGRIFVFTSTARVRAYDAKNGKKLWDVETPQHAPTMKKRAELLADPKARVGVSTGRGAGGIAGPCWSTSMVVAEGVLVVPTFVDGALRGLDVNTGATLWEIPKAIFSYATPNVWSHGGREYLLCGSEAGVLRLVDPVNGKECWKIEGLGPINHSLSPSANYVLCNGRQKETKEQKGGLWTAIKLSPQKGERTWSFPDEPQFAIHTVFDVLAMQRYQAFDGRFFAAMSGTFVIADESTGRILWQSSQDELPGLPLISVVEDTIIARANASHGSQHGGRHPIRQFAYDAATPALTTLDDDFGPNRLDLVNQTSGYEVVMDPPVIAARVFERTERGTLVCYDLRASGKPTETWNLDLHGGYIGLEQRPLPLRATITDDGIVLSGKSNPPDDKAVGLPGTTARTSYSTEAIRALKSSKTSDGLTADTEIDFGSHSWPVRLDLQRQGDQVSGTWKRTIPALAEENRRTGKGMITFGKGPSPTRIFPTPWLKGTPWSKFGENPAGTSTYILKLDAISWGTEKRPVDVTFVLDHDGKRFVRAAGVAFRVAQNWVEIDASKLNLENGHLTGTAMFVLNRDVWTAPNTAAGLGIAGRVVIDATFKDDQATGTYEDAWGLEWTASGTITGQIGGKVQKKP